MILFCLLSDVSSRSGLDGGLDAASSDLEQIRKLCSLPLSSLITYCYVEQQDNNEIICVLSWPHGYKT